MNREIKFRVWDGDNPEGATMHYTEKLCTYENLIGADFNFKSPHYQNDSGKIIMQFTGLKDKNGKEIYEGDIIKGAHPTKNSVISWSNKFASFVIDTDGWMYSHWFGESCNPENIEVIGNIYENPELLEEK